MQILAASIVDNVNRFLHAGYISASPRSFGGWYLPESAPGFQADVASALELQAQASVSLVTHADQVMAASLGGLGSPTAMAAMAVTAAGTAGLLLMGRRLGLRPQALAGILGLTLAAGGLASSCKEPLPDTPPWQDVEIRDYRDPDAATRVILVGLVAEGISNIGQPIENLANIQDEVAWPAKASELSEGEAYALVTYGLDGWGKEMRLAEHLPEDEEAAPSYTVTSAGPDGAFDTSDDISLRVRQSTDSTWDENRVALYLRAAQDAEPAVLIHRWTGEHFEYGDKAGAKALTGTDLFDLVHSFEGTTLDYLKAAFDETSVDRGMVLVSYADPFGA
jgi:hypothetical protein